MADRYWVGGSGTWDGVTTTHWSATSGGAGGASVPTANAFFDANSGAAHVTLSGNKFLGGSLNCTGFTGTLDKATYTIELTGNLNLSAAMALINGQDAGFTLSPGAGATSQVTCNGHDLEYLISDNTVTSLVSLQDDLIARVAIELGIGGLLTNNHKVTTKYLALGDGNGGSHYAVLTAGTSTLVIKNDGGPSSQSHIGFDADANALSLLDVGDATLQIDCGLDASYVVKITGEFPALLTFDTVQIVSATAGATTRGVYFQTDLTCNDFRDDAFGTVAISSHLFGTTLTFTTCEFPNGTTASPIPIGYTETGAVQSHTWSWVRAEGTVAIKHAQIANNNAGGGAAFYATGIDGGGNTGWIFAAVIAFGETTLREVVENQCARAGLDSALVDASALETRTVRALAITQISSPRAIIEMLMQAYGFTCVESDKIYFRWRGQDTGPTIPYDDLVISGGAEVLPITKLNEIELPVQIFVTYSNIDDDYQDGSESSDRIDSAGQNTSAVTFPVAFTPTEARQIADRLVTDSATANFAFGPFALSRDYAALEPSDVVTLVASDGTEFRVRLTKKTEAAGILTFEGVSDWKAAVSSVASTTPGSGGSTSVTLPVDAVLKLLDMPIISDSHNEAGFYALAKPAADVLFPGAALMKSADDVERTTVAAMPTEGSFGVTTTVLGSGAPGQLDERNSVTVNVGIAALSSVTRATLLAGRSNLMMVGSELLQFRDATMLSAGIYTLTGLLRGLRGTEWAVGTHAAGEAVALIDGALVRVPMSNAEIGSAFYWRAVTLGRSAATASSQTFTDNAVGLKPYAPADLRVARDASDNITVTLQRRTRLATRLTGPLGISVPLGEAAESYAVDVYSGSGYSSVVRTLTASSPSFAYSAANQVADFGSAQAAIYFKAYQLSVSTGRGYAATGQG